MKTYEELIEKSEQVRTNELPESNTHDLVGELFTDMIELQKQTSKDNENTFKEKVDKTDITGVFGASVDKIIHQKFFTEQILAIENDLGSESTSESEDGTVWGKLISIIQDVDSNSSSISNLETILSKSSLFKNLGIITGLSALDTVDTPGYYTYTKSLNEGEVIKGILVVSKVSYPGSFSFLQIRHELGKTYQREYDLDERVWGEWEMAGESKSVFNQVSYGDIDTVKTYGIYEVSDSDSLTRDIMFVTYSSEHGVTKQTYINTNPNFPIPELSYRTFDGESWSDWIAIGGSKKELFTENLTVKLNSGKSFGKYLNGDVIHCKGMTAIEVIQMALDETASLKFNSFLMDILPEQPTGTVISGNKEIRFFLNDQSLARANSLSIIDITSGRAIASGLPVTSPVTVDIGTVTADAGQKRQWKATVIEDSTGKTIESPLYTVTWKAPIIYLYYGEVDAAPESIAVVGSGNKIVSTNKQFQISAESKVGNFIAFPSTMTLKSIENASFSGDWWYNAQTGDDFYDHKQTMSIDGITYNVWCMVRPLPMGVKANVVFN